MQKTFDRATEDLGNSIHMEHVNVQIPDQRLSTLFYVAGLGLTRDPYLMVSDNNMWINAGRTQFHLPTGQPQVLRGHTGIVIPGRAALLERLTAVRPKVSPTRASISASTTTTSRRSARGATASAATSPTPRASAASRSAFRMSSSTCRPAARDAIAAFYRAIVDVPADVVNGDGRAARVMIGKDQHLLFRETDRPLPEFDGHHIAIYVVNFSGPHGRLKERNLVSQEDNPYQYRFRDIADLDSGRMLFTIEHEVRSVSHPMFMRPLVNRNPTQNNRNYAAGYQESPLADGAGAVRSAGARDDVSAMPRWQPLLLCPLHLRERAAAAVRQPEWVRGCRAKPLTHSNSLSVGAALSRTGRRRSNDGPQLRYNRSAQRAAVTMISTLYCGAASLASTVARAGV